MAVFWVKKDRQSTNLVSTTSKPTKCSSSALREALRISSSLESDQKGQWSTFPEICFCTNMTHHWKMRLRTASTVKLLWINLLFKEWSKCMKTTLFLSYKCPTKTASMRFSCSKDSPEQWQSKEIIKLNRKVYIRIWADQITLFLRIKMKRDRWRWCRPRSTGCGREL